MKTFGLISSLAFFVPAFALLGAFATLDGGASPWWGLTIGSVIGIFFALGFGGVRGRWLDYFCGPEKVEVDQE